jgi:hypothetical protein
MARLDRRPSSGLAVLDALRDREDFKTLMLNEP